MNNLCPPPPPPKEKEAGGGIQGHVEGKPGYADATPGIPLPAVAPCPGDTPRSDYLTVTLEHWQRERARLIDMLQERERAHDANAVVQLLTINTALCRAIWEVDTARSLWRPRPAETVPTGG